MWDVDRNVDGDQKGVPARGWKLLPEVDIMMFAGPSPLTPLPSFTLPPFPFPSPSALPSALPTPTQGFGDTPPLPYSDNNMRSELLRTVVEAAWQRVNATVVLVSPSMSGWGGRREGEGF